MLKEEEVRRDWEISHFYFQEEPSGGTFIPSLALPHPYSLEVLITLVHITP